MLQQLLCSVILILAMHMQAADQKKSGYVDYYEKSNGELSTIQLSWHIIRDSGDIVYKRGIFPVQKSTIIEMAARCQKTGTTVCTKTTYDWPRRTEIVDTSLFAELKKLYHMHKVKQAEARKKVLQAVEKVPVPIITQKIVKVSAGIIELCENKKEETRFVFDIDGIINEAAPDRCHQRTIDNQQIETLWYLERKKDVKKIYLWAQQVYEKQIDCN